MHAQKLSRLVGLPRNQALSLFLSKVGEDTLKFHPNITKLAEVVVEECHGIPLALITTGSAMAGVENPREWEFAIDQLRTNPADFSGIEREVFHKLKFSYDRLHNEQLRKCFLYCAVFPEDFTILNERLIHLWLGEGFLDKKNGVNDALNQGRYIIGTLKRSCLLEQGEYADSVKMHDLIRDMALWIANEQEAKNEKILVQVGDKWDEANGIAKWENAARLSLWGYSGKYLASKVPNCPNLVTLFVRKTKLKELSNEFFHSTKALRVMDMSENWGIMKLPSSIGSLSNLQFLNLRFTSIDELPFEIEPLKSLTTLIVGGIKVPKKVISSISSLEVFCIFGEPPRDDVRRSAVQEREMLEGLDSLEHLRYVELHIYYDTSVTFLTESNKLQSCIKSLSLSECDKMVLICISSGLVGMESLNLYNCRDVEELRIEVTKEKEAQLFGYSHSDSLTNCCYDSFRRLRFLKLLNCFQITSLTYLLYATNLETLEMSKCLLIEEIISDDYGVKQGSSTENMNFFSSLTSITFHSLPKLRSIFPHALPFPCLKKITVDDCPMLKKLPFDSYTAKTTRLEEIGGCERWWDLLDWESEATKELFVSKF